MLSVEEYIARRKREDKLNEFDKDSQAENLQKVVSYVFEYFNNYLDMEALEEQTVLSNERLMKFRKQLDEYDEEVQEWLMGIYTDHDKQIHRSIINFLKKEELFFLYSTDSEFRSVSYECYAELKKKNSFLRDQTEMLFQFIKNYHQIRSREYVEKGKVFITPEVDEWVEETWKKHQVNVLIFAFDWVVRFYDNPDMWSPKHRKRVNDSWRKYEYDINQKSNLFGLDALYKRIPKKSFIRGRKQEIEVIMMYFWLHSIDGSEGDWQEYLDRTLIN